MFRRSVLTHRFQSESGSVILAMDIVTIRLDTAITRMGTTDLIATMAITGDPGSTGTTGTGFTATTGITIAIATNVKKRLS